MSPWLGGPEATIYTLLISFAKYATKSVNCSQNFKHHMSIFLGKVIKLNISSTLDRLSNVTAHNPLRC